MYLKAIELHGFKSFPEKTKIEFDKGMSAVVGPNGSGKSNISDAIRWVLGETSSRQLRGSGKMEDIIFGGTTKRNPMGFASVSLTLDNTQRTFDVDSDEVTVTRKYYRGGDSEYYINGSRVRLRDIQELFFDTGLGKNGYSVVSQGKVSEIVTSKPENRREIFEEASGIAKFRFKKNEAERRLAQSEDNITRLTDILAGYEERVGPLEKESEKAKQFVALAAQRKEMEISLWIDTVDKSKELIRQQQRRLEIMQADKDELDHKLEQSDNYLEQRYLYSNSLIGRSNDNNDAIRSFEGQISRQEQEKTRIEVENSFNLKQIDDHTKALAAFEADGETTSRQRTQLEGDISATNDKITAKQQQRAQYQMQLDQLVLKAQEKGDEKSRLSGQIHTLNLSLQENRLSISAIDSRNETVNESVKSAQENLARAQEYLADTADQAEDLKDFIQTTQAEITKNMNIRNGLMMKKRSADENLAVAQQKVNDNLNSQHTTQDRIRILTDLENNMDGFAQSVRTVLKKAKDGSLGGIIGSVAQVINVKKGYETAVEIALGYALQNIITENESAAKRAIEFLKSSHGGRATFLPLDTVRPSTFTEKLPDWACTGDSVIEASPKYKNIISNLLGRTIIVDDINSASSLAKKLNYRYRIVTLDGQQVNAGGSFTGGSVSKSAGLFTRKTEIEELNNKLAKLREDNKALQKSLLTVQDSVDALTSQIEACDSEISDLNLDKSNADIEYARLVQATKGYQTTVDNIQADMDNFKNTLLENGTKKTQLLKQCSEIELQVERLEKQRSLLDAQDAQGEREQAQLAEQISQLKLDVVALEGDLRLLVQNLENLDTFLADRRANRRKMLEEISEYKARNQTNTDKLQEIADSISSLRQAIADKEAENKAFVQERMAIESERIKITNENKSLTDQRDDLRTQITRIEERIYTMETSYDEIITKLWEEYELTVQTAREFAVPVTDEAATRRELASVRSAIKRLGNVNVGAIEEYQEVSQKYNYLKGQLADLSESRNRLIKLITSLNGEMKVLFTESFNTINQNFGRIFTELFGGGTAKLELTDKEDVLSSGIEIIVSPPGKVIKSLTALSGGEQALVAISIYFAILAHNPSPFCVLDEIEAALDDVNVTRYANYLHRISDKTQFIVITHRRGTMEASDVLYGVTMQEDGISKLMKLDVENLTPSILN